MPSKSVVSCSVGEPGSTTVRDIAVLRWLRLVPIHLYYSDVGEDNF